MAQCLAFFLITYCFSTGREERCGWFAGTGNPLVNLVSSPWICVWWWTYFWSFRFLFGKWLSFMINIWHMWITVSKITHFFTRYVLEHGILSNLIFLPRALGLLISAPLITFYFCRHLKKLLKSSATRVLLVAQVLNFLPHSATTFSKKVGVRNWVMKPLKRLWRRWALALYLPFPFFPSRTSAFSSCLCSRRKLIINFACRL